MTTSKGGDQKKITFQQSFTTKGGGVGGDVKELLSFFINQFFVGVFQYDFGPPKHALELRDYIEYFVHPVFSFFI